MAPDGRMFQASRKGELYELKIGLNANTTKERKTALKRTVAAMTLGKDVSSLFTDVVKNTAGDLSMKKLVYLYIINYAQSKPDLAILIVNTFIKDAVDPNPLIRALAIRTMALIPLDKITEYLCDPLHRALKDQDPYVRKTAAVCVAKLYDTNPSLAIEEGFVVELQQLLSDGNPMTVSNAVAALSEIADSSGASNLLSLTSSTVPHFLAAMSECTEWGQIFILDAISSYIPSTSDEADLMVERIVPRLQHANPGVVLSAVRNIINLMPRLDVDAKREFLVKKMSAPLVTMLTSYPELQFVALRNISLLVGKYPQLLSSDIRVLFVSYADPLYVKTEKLNLLVRLTNPENVQQVLTELMEYTGEVDRVFAQKAVECIGRIAVRMPAFAEECVMRISDLLKRRVVHVTEQVALALKDVLRAYPNEYDQVIGELCEVAEDIEEPDAKGALVWIIGEHADRIPTAVDMLRVIAASMDEETIAVQLQILTAAVKVYLLRGPEAQSVTDEILNYATQESENVDVRDRGFIYVRLVSGGFDSAQQIVLSNKQGVEDTSADLPPELQQELLRSLSSVAAVYHKPAKCFQGARRKAPVGEAVGDMMAEEDLLGLDESQEASQQAAVSTTAAVAGSATSSQQVGDSLLDDILGSGSSTAPALPAPQSVQNASPLDDLSSLGINPAPQAATSNGEGTRGVINDYMKDLLAAENGKGLAVRGCITRNVDGAFAISLMLRNTTAIPMTDFAIQLNKNSFGFVPSAPLTLTSPLAPSTVQKTEVPLALSGSPDTSRGFSLQIAIKYNPGGVVYFALDVADHIAAVLDKSHGPLAKPAYLSTWKSVPDSAEVKAPLKLAADAVNSVDWITKKLASAGVFTVAKRMSAKPPVLYISAVLTAQPKLVIMGEVTMPVDKSNPVGMIASRTTIPFNGSRDALISFNETCSALLGR